MCEPPFLKGADMGAGKGPASAATGRLEVGALIKLYGLIDGKCSLPMKFHHYNVLTTKESEMCLHFVFRQKYRI